MGNLKIGIAYNLKQSLELTGEAPEDIAEELDCEETIDAIENALQSGGYGVVRLGGGSDFIDRLRDESPDLVFNIAEGFGSRSREAHIPSILEFLGLPYTGSDPLVLALTLEKALTKRVVASLGVKTPAFRVVRSLKEKVYDFPLPAILKPLYEGSSMGIRLHSKVMSYDELNSLAESLILHYNEPVLVEEFLPGPELTVGLIGNGKDRRIIGIMEIVPRKIAQEDFIYSLEVKRAWREEVEYRVNPDYIISSCGDELRSSVLKIAEVIDIRDFARFDFRLDKNGVPNFLEINPLPGLNPNYSDLPIMAYAVGIQYNDMILEIVESARKRYGSKGCHYLQQGS